MARYVGIDPSTKTGFVVLDEDGEVWEAQEIEGQGSEDPKRMFTLVRAIKQRLEPGDHITIEGFAHGAKGKGVGTQYGIGWGIRLMLYGEGLKYTEVAPTALKKFTGAGGTAGKENVAVEVYKRWGFQSKSNNITDAYVLAQIARAMNQPVPLIKVQQEVINKLRGRFE